MEKSCRNCKYWNNFGDSMGYCALQPMLQDFNPLAFVLDEEPYKITDADGTCDDFETRDEKMPEPHN